VRISAGSRPAFDAASSITLRASAIASSGIRPSDGIQPSAARPVSRSMRGL